MARVDQQKRHHQKKHQRHKSAQARRHKTGGFDLISPLYDLLANLVFRGAILKAQTLLLPELKGARLALMIGGGTGELLALALRAHPQLKVRYLEASKGMIKRAKARLSQEEQARVVWVHDVHLALYERPALLDGVDTLITCFFLDVLSPSEARSLILWVSAHLRGPRGPRDLIGAGRAPRWLLADFQPHRGWRGALISLMYAFFQLTAGLRNQRLTDYRGLLREAAWAELGSEPLARALIYSARFKLLFEDHT